MPNIGHELSLNSSPPLWCEYPERNLPFNPEGSSHCRIAATTASIRVEAVLFCFCRLFKFSTPSKSDSLSLSPGNVEETFASSQYNPVPKEKVGVAPPAVDVHLPNCFLGCALLAAQGPVWVLYRQYTPSTWRCLPLPPAEGELVQSAHIL